jgi:hypothetical protein
MPSTYSPSLKIELIGNGEQSGTWGQTTNNNMGTLIEQAIAGVESITLTGNYTLTSFNGLSDQARNAVLVFNGSLAAPANVTAPAVQKTYIITNNSGANVTIKTASGNGVTILNGLNSLVYCDGNDFYTAVNVNNVIGDLTVSGNETIGGNLTIGTSFTSANLAMTANTGIVTMAGNTGAFLPPTGTTAQRPASAVVGMSRWNIELGVYEIYNGLNWQIIASGTYSVSALIVAGGGGGSSGGGAAGGLISTASFIVTPTTAYTITIGAGGSPNVSGSNTSALGFTPIGGGYGGDAGQNGANGGSGGGAGWGLASAGTGTSGQGNNGGLGSGGNGFASVPGGGGGGAGGTGTNATTDNSGNGGSGTASSITGTSITYAGGGGGGNYTGGGGGAVGTGGSGGGANGADSTGIAGSANTGGGGGGSNRGSVGGPSGPGGAGGSGVVIISYQNPTQRATGGSVTNYTAGGNVYWVHTFTTSGTFTA